MQLNPLRHGLASTTTLINASRRAVRRRPSPLLAPIVLHARHKPFTQREVTLAEESANCVKEKGRPLRIAVDASVVLWKWRETTRKAASYGGMNHPSRTFMTQVCNLMTQGVQAVYVFDGPGRPAVKRDKCRPTAKANKPYVPPAGPSARTAQDIEQEHGFNHMVDLAKQLLDLMAVPRWDAPGEAEAECVALERAGGVDGILTSDGDALAFGGRCIYRENKDGNVRVQKVVASELEAAGLDTSMLPLAALLAGGDYHNGLKNCGFKFALRIAKDSAAVKKLSGIGRSAVREEARKGMLSGWRVSQWKTFMQEVRNISNTIATHIPPDWPSAEVLGLYVRPITSDASALDQIRPTLWRANEINIADLRSFTARMFGWHGRQRAKQFLSRLTPGLFAGHLMAAGCQGKDKGILIVQARLRQQRKNTMTKSPMVKVKFMPLKVAPIDYDVEPILPGYEWPPGEGDKRDPKDLYEQTYPEFLVRFGAPSSLGASEAGRDNKRRKTGQTPSSSSTTKVKTPKQKPLDDACSLRGVSKSTMGAGDQACPAPEFRLPKPLSSLTAGDADVI